MLDIGCGTASILQFLPDIKYTGFDMSRQYIDYAKKKYGDRGVFFCRKIGTEIINEFSTSFDIVLAKGILHHLNDEEAIALFEVAKSVLKPGGRLITFDGCYREGQSRIARFILSQDRGRFVRTKEEHERLAKRVFSQVQLDIYDDLARIPYTHIIGKYSL